MNQINIFIPMLTLMGWTFLVLLLVPYRKFKTVFQKQTTAKDYQCGESDDVPVYVKLPNRTFMNLLTSGSQYYRFKFWTIQARFYNEYKNT